MKNNVIKELSTQELQERLTVDKMQLNKMKINLHQALTEIRQLCLLVKILPI